MDRDKLISPAYLAANQELHEGKGGFGGSGWKHHEHIVKFAEELKIRTLLDYGCGESTLKKQLSDILKCKFKVRQYDPAVARHSALPPPCDLVVCTDVLEHVEPELLLNVIGHIHALTIKGAYIVIATRPANKLMPDGSNAHKIIEDTPWWLEKLRTFPWTIRGYSDIRRKGGTAGHEVRLWLEKS